MGIKLIKMLKFKLNIKIYKNLFIMFIWVSPNIFIQNHNYFIIIIMIVV